MPDAIKQLPDMLQRVVATPITLSGLTAIILSLVIPDQPAKPAPTQASAEAA